jgi:hypothetical protein
LGHHARDNRQSGFRACDFEKFAGPLRQRYGRDSLDVRIRFELQRDRAGFAIGPHTDAPHKVFTGLFYLPQDHSQKELGTSIFLPKQRDFANERGQQFPFELFEEHARMPFIPNSMFMFMKTHNSFHGRYEIPENLDELFRPACRAVYAVRANRSRRWR